MTTWRKSHIVWAASAVMFPLTFGASLRPDALADFFSFWFAGHAISNPALYSEPALTALARQSYPAANHISWFYPPPTLFVFGALARLPLTLAFAVWNGVTAVLFYLAARPYMPSSVPKILAVLTPAAIANIYFGQFGLLMGALWLWAFRCKPWAAALLTIKPHIALLAAIPTFSRQKLAFQTAAILVVLVAVSAAAFGLDVWQGYLAQILHQGNLLGHGGLASWVVYGVTPMIGYPAWAWLLFAAAAAYLLSWNFNVFTAATATFLISPYGFGYDMPVVCLGFGLMLSVNWTEMDGGERLLATLAFLAPVLTRFGTWWIPFVLLLGLWVQVRIQRPALGFRIGTGRKSLFAFLPTAKVRSE